MPWTTPLPTMCNPHEAHGTLNAERGTVALLLKRHLLTLFGCAYYLNRFDAVRCLPTITLLIDDMALSGGGAVKYPVHLVQDWFDEMEKHCHYYYELPVLEALKTIRREVLG